MKPGQIEIHDIAVSFGSGNYRLEKTDVKLPSPKKKLKNTELELFARTLSGLLKGGVPILKALEGLEKVASSKEFKDFLSRIKESVQQGAALSTALEKSGCAPAFFYQTVYAGEVSGHVSKVLEELSEYLKKEKTLKNNIRNALVYPAFILAVGFITLGVLTCYVLPKLRIVYEGFGTELPLITKIILGSSNVFLPTVIALILVVNYFVMAVIKKGQIGLVLYKTPYVGDFFRGFVRAQFSRLLSLLIESSIPVFEALEIVEKTFNHHFIKQDIVSIKGSLASGGGFSSCINNVRWMDPVSQMLIVSGEETGRLGASFFQIARDTELALEDRVNLTVKLIEPCLILVIGLSVGFVVIGTVLPIFDMSAIAR